MTQDDLQEIKDLIADESGKWRLDVGDWIAYVEDLVDEVDRLNSQLNAGSIPTLKEAVVSNHECVYNPGLVRDLKGSYDGPT